MINKEKIEEAFKNTYLGEKISFNSDIGKSFELGAKWQAERMYSYEDLLSAFEAGMMFIGEDKGSFKEWFEQFKKK